MILLIILFIVSGIINVILFKGSYELMKFNKKMETKILRNNKEILKIYNYIDMLELENEILKNNQYDNASDISNKKEIKEALKFAMLQAHPDNPNGSNEKFIKYKELYDKLQEEI